MLQTTHVTNQPVHRREVKTYKLRRGRVTQSQAAAIEVFGADFVWPAEGNPLNLPADINPSLVDIVVEIGFGMGEATAKIAADQPELGVLALDLHTPGVGRLISILNSQGSTNVRIIEGDALEVLKARVADASLAGVRLFFPDPWPKKRHHKRRFVQPDNLNLVAQKVRLGGFLHIATDWPEYAEFAEEMLLANPNWELYPEGGGQKWAQPQERPRTRFEQRGMDAGRPIRDLVAKRI
jgi:tRNA (guanine-N7-)-methyltransferase